jgi:peptidyl-prolyl cis-trans isomerase A (cyclophilin A)
MNRQWMQVVTAIMAMLLLAAFGFAQTKAAKQPAAKNPVVEMDTTMGVIKIELLPAKAPITAKNFIDYVNSGFFTGTIIHRVVPNFVIQGGGYTTTMARKPTQPPIKNESDNGLKNLRGTLSMARYADPNSATSQFFINLQANPSLDAQPGKPGYAVFAKVIDGMAVVDKIAAAKTAPKGAGFENVPVQTIAIKSAKVLP